MNLSYPLLLNADTKSKYLLPFTDLTIIRLSLE